MFHLPLHRSPAQAPDPRIYHPRTTTWVWYKFRNEHLCDSAIIVDFEKGLTWRLSAIVLVNIRNILSIRGNREATLILWGRKQHFAFRIEDFPTFSTVLFCVRV